MNWDDIRDPKGEIDFHMEWSTVGQQYTPAVIQQLIDTKGVSGMIEHVNEHFKLILHGQPVMQLERIGDRKVVLQY